MSAVAVANLRREWEESYARLESHSGDARHYQRLLDQVEAVTAELRRRIGQTFTLDELAHAYVGADRWVRDVVEDRAAAPGWPQTLALVQDAAFHLYQRGAVDYAP